MSSKLLSEIFERESCEFNVTVYSLPESNSSSITQRISNDYTGLSNASSPTRIALPTDSKWVRLGNNNAKKPRPIKIVCKTEENATQLIAKFIQAVRNGRSIHDGR